MRIENPEKRLTQFWGRVDQEHIASMLPWLKGNKVLDIGGGYGTTAARINALPGLRCEVIDTDEDSKAVALKLNPELKYTIGNAEAMPYSNAIFDTVLMRDSLHHLYEEGDWMKISQEIIRVLKPGGRLIILDPNVNLLLKTARRLMKHQDAECSFGQAGELVMKMNLKIIHRSFHTLLTLPLSGGYVGFNFVPQIGILQNLVLASDKLINSILPEFLQRQLCWRYLLVADNPQ